MNSSSPQPFTLPIWPERFAGEPSSPEIERFSPPPDSVRLLRNVSRPTLTAYLPAPERANGTAMIICPGGAFHLLAIEHEGEQVAEWFRARGVAAFVLKYSVIESSPDDAVFDAYMATLLSDVERADEVMRDASRRAIEEAKHAVAMVRQHAAKWGVRPDRVGMMGFSAGGQVTVGAALQESAEFRPDFLAPIYPVFFREIVAPKDAPSLFVAVANDDLWSVPACLKLHTAWCDAGRPVELHVYAAGGHGFGMTRKSLPSDSWIDRLGEWMHMQGLL